MFSVVVMNTIQQPSHTDMILVDYDVVDSVMTSKLSARYAVLITGTRAAAYVRNFKTVFSAARVRSTVPTVTVRSTNPNIVPLSKKIM